MADYKSERTKQLESVKPDESKDFRFGIPTAIHGALLGTSKASDYVVDKYKKLKGEDKPEETVKKAKGGTVRSSASKRADGCAQRGKTRGRIV